MHRVRRCRISDQAWQPIYIAIDAESDTGGTSPHPPYYTHLATAVLRLFADRRGRPEHRVFRKATRVW